MWIIPLTVITNGFNINPSFLHISFMTYVKLKYLLIFFRRSFLEQYCLWELPLQLDTFFSFILDLHTNH
jgi:hypothetical protein